MPRHIGFWDDADAPLDPQIEAVARQHSTSRSQVLRAAVQAALPRMRAGELRVPAPRPVGRPRQTEARTR